MFLLGNKISTETKGFDYETTFKVNHRISSKDEQARIRKARVTIVGLLCLVLMIAGAACTNSNGLVPNSLGFSVLDTDSSETALQLIIRPLDENGQLINVEGELSVKLWAVDTLTNARGNLIQQWGNVPVTNDSFHEDSGNYVILEYKDFKPEPEELSYIQLTLTVGGTSMTIERVIPLFAEG